MTHQSPTGIVYGALDEAYDRMNAGLFDGAESTADARRNQIRGWMLWIEREGGLYAHHCL